MKLHAHIHELTASYKQPYVFLLFFLHKSANAYLQSQSFVDALEAMWSKTVHRSVFK